MTTINMFTDVVELIILFVLVGIYHRLREIKETIEEKEAET